MSAAVNSYRECASESEEDVSDPEDDGEPDVSDSDYGQKVIDEVEAAEKANTDYHFAEDFYSYAFLSTVMPTDEVKAKCYRRFVCCGACGMMSIVWLIQALIVFMLWARFGFAGQFKSERGWGNEFVPTRISPSYSESMCGSPVQLSDAYFKHFDSYQLPAEYSYLGFGLGAIDLVKIKLQSKDVSNLHQSMFVLSVMESIQFDDAAFPPAAQKIAFGFLQGWRLFLFIALLSWAITCTIELKDTYTFCHFIYTLPIGPKMIGVDDKDIVIKRISRGQKAYAFYIGFLRILIAIPLFWVGCKFLCSDIDAINLILNAVALNFILEIDALFFSGFYVASRKFFVTQSVIKLNESRQSAAISWEKRTRVVSALVITCLVFLCVVKAWEIRKEEAVQEFYAAAGTCLLVGPTPNTSVKYQYAFAVPGVCETVLFDYSIEQQRTSPSSKFKQPSTMSEMCNLKRVRQNQSIPENFYVGRRYRQLQDACLKMLQCSGGEFLSPKTYPVRVDFSRSSILECSVSSRSSECFLEEIPFPDSRISDNDLAGVGINDAAYPIWCPWNTGGLVAYLLGESASETCDRSLEGDMRTLEGDARTLVTARDVDEGCKVLSISVCDTTRGCRWKDNQCKMKLYTYGASCQSTIADPGECLLAALSLDKLFRDYSPALHGTSGCCGCYYETYTNRTTGGNGSVIVMGEPLSTSYRVWRNDFVAAEFRHAWPFKDEHICEDLS